MLVERQPSFRVRTVTVECRPCKLALVLPGMDKAAAQQRSRFLAEHKHA